MKRLTLLELCFNVKKTSEEELFSWLGFDKDWDVIDLGDRYLRRNCYGMVQFSETKDTFDRWANSTAESFDLKKRSERKTFLMSLLEIKPQLKSHMMC